MNKKDNQRSRLTRMLLKQAYVTLMHQMPSNKITVKEICEIAEVNRSTFYLHFNEPNDVLIELEDEAIAQVAESFQSLSQFKDAQDDVEENLLQFFRYVQRNDDMFRTFLVKNHDSHFKRKLVNFAIEAAQHDFDIKLDSEYKHYAFLYIISGCIELLSDWISTNYKTSEKELCELIYLLCEGSLKAIVLKYKKNS